MQVKSIASDAAFTDASAPTAASQSLPQRQHARACEQIQHRLEQGREKLRKIASAEPASFTAALASIEQQPLPTLSPQPSPPPSSRSVVICEGERERVIGCETVGDVLSQLASMGVDGDYLTNGRMGERLDDAERLSDIDGRADCHVT